MNWVSVILEILKSGLSLWDSKEKTKYIDKLMKIEKEIYEEESKPLEERDQAVIDNLNFDLLLVSRAFAQATRQNITDRS